MPVSPHARFGNDATSKQAKAGVVPIPKREKEKKRPSARTSSLRGSKRVEQSGGPARETR